MKLFTILLLTLSLNAFALADFDKDTAIDADAVSLLSSYKNQDLTEYSSEAKAFVAMKIISLEKQVIRGKANLKNKLRKFEIKAVKAIAKINARDLNDECINMLNESLDDSAYYAKFKTKYTKSASCYSQASIYNMVGEVEVEAPELMPTHAELISYFNLDVAAKIASINAKLEAARN